MTQIGFLACEATLPGSGERRGDAFEHDLEVAALRPAFEKAGLELVEIDWRAPLADFDDLSSVLLGTAWDYQDQPDAFLSKLKALELRGVAVHNPPEVVRWNTDKQYLKTLANAGVATIPTLWLDDAGHGDVLDAMAHFGTDRVVVKRQVGAGGLGQHSFSRSDLPEESWAMGRPAMIQPFLPLIVEEGEFTLVFIDGELSHGVRKIAAAGEYRIQSLFGGREEDWDPRMDDVAQAKAVLDALPFDDLLYARIDMARLPDERLALMECELIEPYLYPEQGPELGERLAAAIVKRLH